MLNKKVLGLLVSAIVIGALISVFLTHRLLVPPQESTGELDFTVSGTNDCLRFLNSTVSVCYIPFRIDANEKWQLTINATKMPSGANGWTDVYLYKGYWDKGTEHKCLSEDVYSILNQIKSADAQVKGNSPFKATFGGSTPQSYTVFFIFPPGGQATFHATYKQL